MGAILSEMTSDRYWVGPGDPLPPIDPRYEGEQIGSNWYHDQIIERYQALGLGWQDLEIHSTVSTDLPEYIGSGLMSLLRDSRWKGAAPQLEDVIAAHPLERQGLTNDEALFEQMAGEALETGYYGQGARWVDLESGVLIERQRIFALPSHIPGYTIGLRSDEVQVITPPNQRVSPATPRPRKAPDMGLPRPPHSGNIVLPELVFRRPYSEAISGLDIRRKIVSGYIMLPRDDIGTKLVPRQQP